MSLTRPKIAYLTSADACDRRSWSGTHYALARALQDHCGDVVHVGPVSTKHQAAARAAGFLTKRLFGRTYDSQHSLLTSAAYARVFRGRLRVVRPDVIFAAASSSEISLLKTNIPIVYLSDSTFALVENYYPGTERLLRISRWEAHQCESRALQRSAAMLYPSSWAARSAIRDYGAEARRVHVVPFGANLLREPSRDVVLERSLSSTIRLLFIGVDWARKGGDIAVEALADLRQSGVDAKLSVCGCTPPPTPSGLKVETVPFLDKNKPQDYARFEHLLLSHDFLIVPTRADCYGIVFCEAASYGLPALATDTGGVSGAVRVGRSGFLFPASAGGVEYSRCIQSMLARPERYKRLVADARAAYERELNWDAWGHSVKQIIDTVL